MKITIRKSRTAVATEEIETDSESVPALLDLLIAHVGAKGDATQAGRLADAIAARAADLTPERFEAVLDMGRAVKMLIFWDAPGAALRTALIDCARRYPVPLPRLTFERVLALKLIDSSLLTAAMLALLKQPAAAPKLTKTELRQQEEAEEAAIARSESRAVLAKVTAFCRRVQEDANAGLPARNLALALQAEVADLDAPLRDAALAELEAGLGAVALHARLLAKLNVIVAAMRNEPAFQQTFLGKMEAPSDWLHPALEDTRRKVDAALLHLSQSTFAFGPGCALRYRGSLSDGVRNANKSMTLQEFDQAFLAWRAGKPWPAPALAPSLAQQPMARTIDLNNFDVDAFIEIPDAMWDTWVEEKLIGGPGISKGKISLTDISNHLLYFVKTPTELRKIGIAPEKAALGLALRAKVGVLIDAMAQARARLSAIRGYKRNSRGDVDFSLIVQPRRTSDKQLQGGKLYPVGQLDAPLSGHHGREVLQPLRRTVQGQLVAVLPDAPVTVPFHPDGRPRLERSLSMPTLPGMVSPRTVLPLPRVAPGRAAVRPSHARPGSLSLQPGLQVPAPTLVVGDTIMYIALGAMSAPVRMRVTAIRIANGLQFHALDVMANPATQDAVAFDYDDFGKTWRKG